MSDGLHAKTPIIKRERSKSELNWSAETKTSSSDPINPSPQPGKLIGFNYPDYKPGAPMSAIKRLTIRQRNRESPSRTVWRRWRSACTKRAANEQLNTGSRPGVRPNFRRCNYIWSKMPQKTSGAPYHAHGGLGGGSPGGRLIGVFFIALR